MRLPTLEDFAKLYAPNGSFATQKMFWEFGRGDSRKKYPPIFTLKLRPHKGLPSAYQVYMDSIDEYDAAMKIVPSLKVWDDLIATDWFFKGDIQHAHDGVKVWREHMKLRDSSLAKKLILEQTKEGSITAARTLLSESKVKAPVGRKNRKNTMPTSTVTRIKDFNKDNL